MPPELFYSDWLITITVAKVPQAPGQLGLIHIKILADMVKNRINGLDIA
jgi:hypothetical protein